jgi:hypothetical protein
LYNDCIDRHIKKQADQQGDQNMKTLQQTMDTFGDVIFFGLTDEQIKIITNKFDVTKEQIFLGSCIVHNLLDNGVISYDDVRSNGFLAKVFEEHGVGFSTSTFEKIKVMQYNFAHGLE